MRGGEGRGGEGGERYVADKTIYRYVVMRRKWGQFIKRSAEVCVRMCVYATACSPPAISTRHLLCRVPTATWLERGFAGAR